jgi:hypothetical protein
MSEPTSNGNNENGWQAFDNLSRFLTEDEWHPQQLEDKTIYRVGFNGENGQLTCYAQIRVDLEQFLFYVVAPIKVPEETRLTVAEFVTRANYGLGIGNFELGFEEGEVRYKSSLDFEGTPLTLELIKNTIYPAVQTMDHYLPGLLSVIYGNKTPAEAIAEIEGE